MTRSPRHDSHHDKATLDFQLGRQETAASGLDTVTAETDAAPDRAAALRAKVRVRGRRAALILSTASV